MTPRALVLRGGWPGHAPQAVGRTIARAVEAAGLEVEVADTLRPLDDAASLGAYAVIVPVWTMGRLSEQRELNLYDAVRAGTGLAGCHGMADAFRAANLYQFTVGGQFAAHPGGDAVRYDVVFREPAHPVTRGCTTFSVQSERYHLHVDPSNDVLATTPIPREDTGEPFDMPVVWVRRGGRGRVFYCSVGHTHALVASAPVLRLVTRGVVWAAGADELLDGLDG